MRQVTEAAALVAYQRAM